MLRAGYSPSVRLFEAAACGAAIISDRWRGVEEVFAPNEEILLADGSDAVLAALSLEDSERSAIGETRTHARADGSRRRPSRRAT